MLEKGTYSTITELAHAERIDHGNVGRILRLMMLVPDIVKAILTGRQPGTMTLAFLVRALPMHWEKQKSIASGF